MITLSSETKDLRKKAIALNIDIRYWDSLLDKIDPVVALKNSSNALSSQKILLTDYWNTIAKRSAQDFLIRTTGLSYHPERELEESIYDMK